MGRRVAASFGSDFSSRCIGPETLPKAVAGKRAPFDRACAMDSGGVLTGAAVGAARPCSCRHRTPPWGSNLPGLLAYARAQSPELQAMQREADAAAQRVGSAGALPDPVLRIELMNITTTAIDQNHDPRLGQLNQLPMKFGERS